MFSYQPPVKHMQYVLSDVLSATDTLRVDAGYNEIDEQLVRQVLEEAGRFTAEVLFPVNASGDRQGCRFESGAVFTPDGFRDAYRQFVDSGWAALACDPGYGGQGLPHVLNCALQEMMISANHAWTMYPGVLHGAYTCLKAHGSEELKQYYLPKIVSGEWLVTMALTEPQAGSDVGLLRTRAVEGDTGTYRLSGNKIFISGGEHDLTENIVHLVLARIPGGPEGSKGVSLFVVPKICPDGSRNQVTCTGIEHKMGIRGSATCSLEFAGATGWLVGEPHRGLAAMFVMMNAARMLVGAQGLGIAETVYQNAARYANERLQMKAVDRPAERKDQPADPIALHPPVRRLLLSQRAYVEGGRMMLYWSGLMLDLAERHPIPQRRQDFEQMLALVTPVVKAFLTEKGFQGASDALQVYGGYGVITETGVEQYLRDCRVTMIYEGTNEIQAIDLVVRKILGDQGVRLGRFLELVRATVQAERTGPFAGHSECLSKLATELAAIARAVCESGTANLTPLHWVAGDVLRLMGHCIIGWLLLRSASASCNNREDDYAFHDERLETVDHYFAYEFTETHAALAVLRASFAQHGLSLTW
ncbi:acyl-CoA dehydrogenase [Massilia sp. METH4]|uniref:acyl-CoA dehydrogenase n=1 Tax=Massilia sp. METH4 TaxID=3123041 RepID=UPI0030CD3019